MKKYVIYSAVIGQYDSLQQPLVVDERFDYIIFSNNAAHQKDGVWEIRSVDYFNPVQTKIARWVKTHPEELLPEYDVSVWIDASVLIKSNYIYERAIDLYDKKIPIATHIHPERNCIYNEMFGMMVFQWEEEDVILKWGHKLREESYPRNIGTFETRVMYRSHKDPEVIRLDGLWWKCIESYSRRDQLSFNYVLWKYHIACESFLPRGCDVHNSEHFQICEHSKSSSKRVGSPSWLIKYYYKHPDSNIEDVYYWIYKRAFPGFWSVLLGQFYRIKHLIHFVFR